MKANRQIWKDLRMTKANDGRIKLSDEDREVIRKLYFQEHLAIRAIARMFEKKCSRSLIQIVIRPEKGEVIRRRAIELKRWEQYNTKEIHGKAMIKYRAKLKKVYNIEDGRKKTK